MEGGLPPKQMPENLQTNHQKSSKRGGQRGRGAAGSPGGVLAQAGAGGTPFLTIFDDLFDDFLAFAWGGSPPSIF